MVARPDLAAPAGGTAPAAAGGGFEVRLANFTGPFDLLLGLITKHELDITEIALAQVTDEFIGYIRGLQQLGQEWALDEASEFLVIAATLLDLKAARLLPSGEVDDDEDLALLEARDLLFARLLQYKAFKQVAALLGARLDEEAERFPRLVSLEPSFAALLPELIWKHTPEQFAALARKALEPREGPPTEVALSHLHAPEVNVREQAILLARRLRGSGPVPFRVLVSDAADTLVVVARFLALLDLFREAVIAFDQANPLGELLVRWSGPTEGWDDTRLSSGFDGTDDTHHPREAGQ
ncbi:MAG: chromosome segregation protein ScpA [Micrococcaceae bacterium]|nr:chromosome segregation protein ScpA [Micrococcaceae bacterium]